MSCCSSGLEVFVFVRHLLGHSVLNSRQLCHSQLYVDSSAETVLCPIHEQMVRRLGVHFLLVWSCSLPSLCGGVMHLLAELTL
jgi:hypothetical protein